MRVESADLLQVAGRADQFPRGSWPEFAFAGRSNVGKSSLINRLLGRQKLARTSATPGRTQTINFYKVNDRFLFVDLPGYGYAKVPRRVQEAWWALVEGYLAGREPLRGVIHILDARHEPTEKDRELQEFLAAAALPSVLALTKADKVPQGRRQAARAAVARALSLSDPEAPLFFSAETGEGASELWRAIQEGLARPARSVPGSPRGRHRQEMA